MISARTCAVAVAVKAATTGRVAAARDKNAGDFQVAWAGNPAPTGRCSAPRRRREATPAPVRDQGQKALRLRAAPARRTKAYTVRRDAFWHRCFRSCSRRQRAVEKRRRYALPPSALLTWSFIREMSGETTTVSPGSSSAGKLIADRLSPAGRHHAQHIAPGQNRVNQRLLPAAERRVTEDTASAAPVFPPSFTPI